MRLGRGKREEGWGNCRRPRSTWVGEVRWQSINIQNRRRARETEGGRASKRRPTDRKRENDREGERERGGGMYIAVENAGKAAEISGVIHFDADSD